MTSKEAFNIIVSYVPTCFKEELETIEKDLTKLEILQKYCQVYEVDYLDKDREYYLTIGMFESAGISKKEYERLKNEK